MDIKEQKNVLRQELKKQRAALSSEFVACESTKITKKVLRLKKVQNAKTVFVYVSTGNEVATHELIETLLVQGRVVCVPKMIDRQEMIPVQIFSLDNLTKGSLGIQEPKNNIAFDGVIDVCIVPGLAFDHSGARLGMGCGHYDRFFDKSKKVHTLGIVFDQFLLACVPQEPHDQSVDVVLSQAQHYGKGDVL